MSDPWKPYIDAAREAGETETWVPDYGDSGAAWQRVEVPSEPTQPDMGMEPDASWLLFNGHLVSPLAPVQDRPRIADIEDLHQAQAALYEADAAGCSDTEYDRLGLQRQQTEAAYLSGVAQQEARDLQARAEFFNADAMAERLAAGEAPVLRTGSSVFGTLKTWMELDTPEAGS